MKHSTLNQSGQALLILLLATLVALTIGLAITQRSLSDVANSSRIDQSSRAFSAAEAGIEQAELPGFSGSLTVSSDTLGNQSMAVVSGEAKPLPRQALELPPIDKSDFAQFWLADPAITEVVDGVPIPAKYYNQDKIDLYFGQLQDYTNLAEQPAVEVNVISYFPDPKTPKKYIYTSNRYYFDSNFVREKDPNRQCIKTDKSKINTSESANDNQQDREFYCKASVTLPAIGLTDTVSRHILMRVRILYANLPHPIALMPLSIANCGLNGCSLPPQTNSYLSTGSSGPTQRRLKMVTLRDVVPFYFDYAIFSAGDIIKNK